GPVSTGLESYRAQSYRWRDRREARMARQTRTPTHRPSYRRWCDARRSATPTAGTSQNATAGQGYEAWQLLGARVRSGSLHRAPTDWSQTTACPGATRRRRQPPGRLGRATRNELPGINVRLGAPEDPIPLGRRKAYRTSVWPG